MAKAPKMNTGFVREEISTFFDNENSRLPYKEISNELLASEELQTTWECYSIIRSVLQGDYKAYHCVKSYYSSIIVQKNASYTAISLSEKVQPDQKNSQGFDS